MTPELVALALRAVAAGAPVPRKIAVMSGLRSVRCPDNGLLYGFGEVSRNGALPLPMALPLLSDPSWLGWVLCEVERRGYRMAIATGRAGGYSVSCGREHPTEWVEWYPSRPSVLVAMLEATK